MKEGLGAGIRGLTIQTYADASGQIPCVACSSPSDVMDSRELPLQARFKFEAMRREVRSAADMEALKKAALAAIDFMEAQQITVEQMLRQRWFTPEP